MPGDLVKTPTLRQMPGDVRAHGLHHPGPAARRGGLTEYPLIRLQKNGGRVVIGGTPDHHPVHSRLQVTFRLLR